MARRKLRIEDQQDDESEEWSLERDSRIHMMTDEKGRTHVHIPLAEAMDGADLSYVRDVLFHLSQTTNRIVWDVSDVTILANGTFGFLADWADAGVEMYLKNPCERIRNHLWFTRFMVWEAANLYRMTNGAEESVNIGEAS